MSDPTKALGYRNKNPGNIRPLGNGAEWHGQTGVWVSPKDPDHKFCIFKDAEHGIRAIAIVAGKTYPRRYGLRTIRGIINRWAPPSDPHGKNHTESYIANVATRLGVGPDDQLPLRPDGRLPQDIVEALADAIIRVECGGMPYDEDLVARGVGLAYRA